MAITTEFKITTDSVDKQLKKAETSVQKSANNMKSSLDDAGKSNFGENIGQNLEKAGKGFDAVNKMGGKVGGVLKNIQQSFMALLNPIGLVITAVTALTAWGVKMWESLTVNEEQAKATLDFIAKMRGRDTGNAKTDLTDNEKRMQRLKKLSAGGMTFDETQEAHEILQKMGFNWTEWGAKKEIIDLLDDGKVEQAEKLAMGRAKENLKKSRKKEIQSLIDAVNSNQKVTGTGVKNELANMTTYEAEYLLQQMINRRSWDWYAGDEDRKKALESQIASMTKIVEIMREQQREEQALTLQEKERAEAKKQAEKDALKKAEADYRKSTKESEELKRARQQKEQTEKKIKLDGMTDAQKVKFYGSEISTSQSQLADAKKAKRDSEAMIRVLKNRMESGELTDQKKKYYYSLLAYQQQQKQLAEAKILNIESHILQLQQQKLKLEKKVTEEKEKQKADDKKAEEEKKKAEEERKRKQQEQRRKQQEQRRKRELNIKKKFGLQSEKESLADEFPDLTEKQIAILSKAMKLKSGISGFDLGNTTISTNELTVRGGFKSGVYAPDTKRINKSIELHTKIIRQTTNEIKELLKKGGLI